MKDEIISIKNEAMAQIMDAKTTEQLNDIKTSYLGRNGKLNSFTKKISQSPKDERKEVGIALNQAKDLISNLIADQLKQVKGDTDEWFDPTIPAKSQRLGSTHLISRAINEISQIFSKMGFVRSRYPEIEWDWYAFGSLNFSENHPARDEWETYIVDTKPNKKLGPMVLTPHTSSGQVREMKKVGEPPIRMINIAKCYRRQSDASHYPMFHQFEGLAIDEGIDITHLKGTIDYFVKEFYGPDVKSRIRPYNFPFTEPSFEVDMSCNVCGGKGGSCKLCREGWLELGGAGMVHPNVMKAGGLNPKKLSGFAFGFGVERVYMMKPGLNIDDLRTLYSNDLRYLKQF